MESMFLAKKQCRHQAAKQVPVLRTSNGIEYCNHWSASKQWLEYYFVGDNPNKGIKVS